MDKDRMDLGPAESPTLNSTVPYGNVVESYGFGDKGDLNFMPAMTMVALQVEKVGKSAGGLVLTETADQDYQTPRALVLAVGPDVKWTRVGDRVYISPQILANKIFRGRATFVLVREDQLYGHDRGLDSSEYVKDGRQ